MDLDPPLHVGHLRVSVLRSDRSGLKEQLIQGLWLTQARGQGGVRMQGDPAVTEPSMTLQQPEVCRAFSQGSCPCIMGPWQWWVAQAPGKGSVDSDLCLLTGFLVAATAASAFHAPVWCPH